MFTHLCFICSEKFPVRQCMQKHKILRSKISQVFIAKLDDNAIFRSYHNYDKRQPQTSHSFAHVEPLNLTSFLFVELVMI